MVASYDEQGNYLYPEGFDPETNEWLPGYEKQQAEWERQYAEAHARWEAHRKQVEDAKRVEDEATSGSSYSSSATEAASEERSAGTLASDEALQALREKLTGNG
jgi:small subunit ribosomal protein S1